MEKINVNDKLMEKYLANMEKAVQTIDRIIPIIWKFDGKVFNARLENTLEKETGCNFSITFLQTRIEIEQGFYSIEERCVHYKTEDYFNPGEFVSRCEYIPNSYDRIRLAYYWDNETGWEDRRKLKFEDSKKRHYFYDDNYNIRISAAFVVNLLLEEQKKLKDKIIQLKEQMLKVEGYREELKEIKNKLEELNKKIPYEIKDFYGIKCYATFN